MSDIDNADTTSEVAAEAPVENTEVEAAPTEDSGQQQPQDGQQAEKPVEEEKIVLTKEEYDARCTAIRSIAERKAKRNAEAELQKNAQQQASQVQQPQNVVQPESPDDLWDANLNRWIPRAMTIDQYEQLAAYIQPQQPIQQQAPVKASQNETVLTEATERQVETLAVRVGEDKIRKILGNVPVQDAMVNAISVDPNGIENLYNAILERPHEIYQICQLSPMEQQAKMWELNQECAKKRAPKVETSATTQPAPLIEGGNFNKPYTEMSYEEKKAFRRREAEKG